MMSGVLLRLSKSVLLTPTLLQTNQSQGYRVRHRNGRRSQIPPKTGILLDKFVKLTRPDGTITVFAPFDMKIRGSYFGQDNKVDEERNRKLNKSILKVKSGLSNSKSGDNSDTDALPPPVDPMTPNPLHLLIYGRRNQKVDSYSIMESFRQTSHIYITDSEEDFIEMESIFLSKNHLYLDNFQNMKPFGTFSVYQPDQEDCEHPANMNNRGNVMGVGAYEVKPGFSDSAFKVYCAPYLLENYDHGIKTVFLVPINMNNIHMHGENEGKVELDASLISGLNLVDLTTNSGDIKIKDVVARDIRITTKNGDVLSEGNLRGNIHVDILGDGDFMAKYVEGRAINAKTDSGGINIYGNCNAENAHFTTNMGNIHIKSLFGNGFVTVKKSGNVFLNLDEGSVNVSINQGGAFISVQNVNEDSKFQLLEQGDLIVTIPLEHQFKIEVVGSNLNIPSKLLNLGEILMDDHSNEEKFTCGDHTGKFDKELATVYCEALNGAVTLIVDSESKSESVTTS